MNLNKLTPFPEWENERYDHEEGEEWKSQLKNSVAKNLYNQWLQVYMLLEALCDGLRPTTGNEDYGDGIPVSESYLAHLKESMLGESAIIPAKISGAEAGDLYVLRMENAAIIRKAANDVYIQCSSFRMMGVASNEELDAVRAEINIFRKYFKEWVNTFEKDGFEDDWGLFK